MKTSRFIPVAHLSYSLVRNRRITVNGEAFTYDEDEMTDSEALHQVLTIRDPGNVYSVHFNRMVVRPV